MSPKLSVLSLVVVLGLLQSAEVESLFLNDVTTTDCEYFETSMQTVEVCGPFGICANVTVPCVTRQTETCVPNYLEWSGCTQSCDGGARIRFGTCSSENCNKVIREIEVCNDSPCAEVL